MRKRIFVFALLILSMLSISTLLLISIFSLNKELLTISAVLHTQEMSISIEVSDYLGINLDNSSLNFGAIMPGNEMIRKITIINPFKENVKTSVEFRGFIASWLSIPEDNFILEPNENKTLSVTLNIPENTPYSNYTGILKLVMKKV